MTEKLLTVTEVARMLNITRPGVWRQLRENRFPNARRCECGQSMLIPLSDLITSIKQHPAGRLRKPKSGHRQ